MRRTVRATPGFFDQLDAQLPGERGPHGEPSTSDYQAYDLLEILERFAAGFDDLPELIAGRPEYRLLVIRGSLVHASSVVAQLAADGAVELVSLKIDKRGPDDHEQDAPID